MLPENWHLVITRENLEYINKVRASINGPSFKHPLSFGDFKVVKHSFGGIVGASEASAFSYNKITTQQFINYYLKNEKMEKTLIGYKLKPEFLYLEDTAAILGRENSYRILFTDGVDYKERNIIPVSHFNGTIEALKAAKVLDLWFDEVWEEPIKIGTHISEKTKNGVKFGCQEFSTEALLVLKDILTRTDYKSSLIINDVCITPELINKLLNL